MCRPSRFLCFHGVGTLPPSSSPSRLRVSSPPSRLRDSSSRSCPLSWGRIARGVVVRTGVRHASVIASRAGFSSRVGTTCVRPRESSSRVPCACPAHGDLERPRELSSCVPCPLPPVALHPCTLHVVIFSTRGDLEFLPLFLQRPSQAISSHGGNSFLLPDQISLMQFIF